MREMEADPMKILDDAAIYSIGDFGLMLGEWMSGFCPFVFLALVFKKCWDADAV